MCLQFAGLLENSTTLPTHMRILLITRCKLGTVHILCMSFRWKSTTTSTISTVFKIIQFFTAEIQFTKFKVLMAHSILISYSYGMWCHVVQNFNHEDRDGRFLRNNGAYRTTWCHTPQDCHLEIYTFTVTNERFRPNKLLLNFYKTNPIKFFANDQLDALFFIFLYYNPFKTLYMFQAS